MDEYNEMWMIVGTWWTQADMAESWWRSGGLHAQWDCGPYNEGIMEILRRCVLLHTPFSFLIVMVWHVAEDISLIHTTS